MNTEPTIVDLLKTAKKRVDAAADRAFVDASELIGVSRDIGKQIEQLAHEQKARAG